MSIGKGSEFCNRTMGAWLQDNDTEMHSTHTEGKSVVVEFFLKNIKK